MRKLTHVHSRTFAHTSLSAAVKYRSDSASSLLRGEFSTAARVCVFECGDEDVHSDRGATYT